MQERRLVPRLVPQPLWGISAARLLAGARWKRIRADAMEAAGGACVVCGVTREKGMIGDEEWEYADGIATLTGVRVVCPDCNAVTHIGSTGARGYGDVAREHMCRINAMKPAEADQIIEASFQQWRERSLLDWRIVVAPDLLARYTDLAILEGGYGPGAPKRPG